MKRRVRRVFTFNVMVVGMTKDPFFIRIISLFLFWLSFVLVFFLLFFNFYLVFF